MGRMMEKRREMGQRKEGREAETKTNSAKKRFSILLLTAGLISVTTLICRCAQFSLTKAIEFIQLRLLPLSQEATNALTQTFHPSTSDRLSHYFQSSWVVFFMLLGFFCLFVLLCFFSFLSFRTGKCFSGSIQPLTNAKIKLTVIVDTAL